MTLLVGHRRRAAAEFIAVFSERPECVWSAPGRVNLIGEHTDYNGGLCLPVAVDFRADCAVRTTGDGRLRIASAQRPGDVVDVPLASLKPGAVTGWAAYVAGAVWQSDGRHAGLEVLIDSDIPEGAGLSSSAAVEVATLAAVSDLRGIDLARAAQVAENDFVHVPCGLMDQMASVLSEAGRALLIDARDELTTPIRFNLGHSSLLVIDTRAPHQLRDGGYAQRRQECEQAARQLGLDWLSDATTIDNLPGPLRERTRHVVTENARVRAAVTALEDGDAASLGALLTASHHSLRDDFHVSVPQLDVAVAAALDAGALGARMTGGGFGGSVIALANDPAHVAGRVEAAFARHEWPEPAWFEVEPADGVQRIDAEDRRTAGEPHGR